MPEISREREPGRKRRVADYAGCLLYLAPAVLALLFTSVILVPRYRAVLEVSGIAAGERPPVLAAMMALLDFLARVATLVQMCGYLLIPAIFLSLVLCETLWPGWQTVRRPLFHAVRLGAVWMALLTLLLLATITLLLAPMLETGGR